LVEDAEAAENILLSEPRASMQAPAVRGKSPLANQYFKSSGETTPLQTDQTCVMDYSHDER